MSEGGKETYVYVEKLVNMCKGVSLHVYCKMGKSYLTKPIASSQWGLPISEIPIQVA